jgi:hypothetical protein
MDDQTLKALIPAVPGMIAAGLEVWKTIVKPLLDKTGYKVTKEQEQEMLMLEQNKNIEVYIEKLEGINKEISQTAISQSQAGSRNIQAGGDITGNVDNSTKVFINTEEKKDEVKKN